MLTSLQINSSVINSINNISSKVIYKVNSVFADTANTNQDTQILFTGI